MTSRNLLPVLLVPTGVVLIPFLAMLFQVEGWAWSPADFVIAWVLIAGVMLAYKLLAAKAVDRSYRAGTALTLLTGLGLIWINGAVGVIGSENNPANLLYAGVLLVGVAGALRARLQARAMAQTLVAMAVTQLLVPVVALAFGSNDFSPGVLPVMALNLMFVASFLLAAWLFRRAHQHTPAGRRQSESIGIRG